MTAGPPGAATAARLRAVLVDDEPLALAHLGDLLEDSGRVAVVAALGDGRAALALLATEPVDVLFLDVEMPELDGLALAARLPPELPVVFTTGHAEHAVRAFEVHAVGYLLKPVGRAELERVLDKLLCARAAALALARRAALEASGAAAGTAAPPSRVPSRVGGRVVLIDLAEVTHFRAADKLVYAVTRDGRAHVVDGSLNELEAQLAPRGLVRVHRAALVDPAHIAELEPLPSGGMRVRLRDSARTELVVARERVAELRRALGLRP